MLSPEGMDISISSREWFFTAIFLLSKISENFTSLKAIRSSPFLAKDLWGVTSREHTDRPVGVLLARLSHAFYFL